MARCILHGTRPRKKGEIVRNRHMKTKSTPPPVSCVKQASTRKSELCVAAITLFLLASNAALHAQVYGITDLGTLPGTKKSVAYGLNDLGQAVGVSSNPTAAIATLFSKGMNTLGAPMSRSQPQSAAPPRPRATTSSIPIRTPSSARFCTATAA
jgi:uncharacterized membrane protein